MNKKSISKSKFLAKKKDERTYKIDAKRVVIVGAGEVGSHISQKLSRANYNVILVDSDEEKIQESRFLADIGTYIGNGCDVQVYIDIQLNEDDLFIAVTSSDESNLIACHLAKAFGCEVKIARVRNSFYAAKEGGPVDVAFWKNLGVEVLFNQDDITSKEIIKLIENPGSVESIDLGKNDLQLVAYRVKENSLLCGRRLVGIRNIPKFDSALVVAAIRDDSYSRHHYHHDHYTAPIYIKAPTDSAFRNHNKKSKREEHLHQTKTLIPNNNFKVQEGDILYISGLKVNLKNIGYLFDSDIPKQIKHIFIFSESNLAFLLAETLSRKYSKNDIYLVLKNKKNAYAARNQLNPKIHVLLVDIHNVQELINEGLDENCVFIGASDKEDDNILACLLVKEETSARTIAIVQSSIYNHIVSYLELDAAVSPKILLVDDVLRALKREVHDVLFSKGSDAEVLEFIVKEDSKYVGKMLNQISFPVNAVIAAMIRGERSIIPQSSTIFMPEDHVIVFALKDSIGEVENFFA